MAKFNKPTSPYYKTPIKDFYLDIWKPRQIPASANDKLVTIEPKYDQNPSRMAYDLYGSKYLWWVFAVRNMDVLVDPISDFKAGTEIYIPNKDTINNLS